MWIKNLSHLRLGRMGRRLDESRGEYVLQALEEMTGKKVPAHLAVKLKHGAEEVDLVRSGLDDTMREAYQAMREIFYSRENVKDFRAAAFTVAIEKIARSYEQMGV